jgi:Cu+-exporting ATPase
VRFHGSQLSGPEENLIRNMVRHSSHPLSNALFDYLPIGDEQAPETYEELPGLGITGKVENQRVTLGSELFVTGENSGENMQESRVYISINGHQKGYFTFTNSYRQGLNDLVKNLKKNYSLHLISGDNDGEAAHLKEVFGPESVLLFNQSPTDKKAYIQKLKAQGEKVLMIGDGLNDAGALSESDIGISIADDIFSFSPACDAILDAENFNRLGSFIGFSRAAFRTVRWSFLISLIYNVIGLSFAVTAQLSPLIAAILMPVSSISVVAFVTFSIRWKSIKLLK